MRTNEETKVVSLAKIIASREEAGPEVEEIDSDEQIIKELSPSLDEELSEQDAILNLLVEEDASIEDEIDENEDSNDNEI